MKKSLLLSLVLFSLFTKAQMPPTAQALYNWAYNKDTYRGSYAVTNGATFSATADGKSFILKWIPASATPSAIPMMVTLHGSSGNVFNEFYLWHTRCAAKGVGIIAVQWYRGQGTVYPNDYFTDDTLYGYIDTALRRIKYPVNKALLHGFSRGSARSYALTYLSVQPGAKNYFCTVFSNSGKPDSAYPLYNTINSGTNHTFLAGKRWGMYCGGQDTAPAQSGCQGMAMAKNWVQANGGTVGLFISDPNLGHGGFEATPAYMDSALSYYVPCFYGTAGVKDLKKNNRLSVYPNPASDNFTISFSEQYAEETIMVYDAYGKVIYENNFSQNLTIDTRNWAKNIYFYRLKNCSETGKIIIE